MGRDPRGSVVADFNGDGVPDLAVVNSTDNDVSILLGRGDGTFQEITDQNGNPIRPAVGTGPVALAAGKFSSNGMVDLAVVDAGVNFSSPSVAGDVAILLGNGDGTFQNSVFVGSLPAPDALVVGDLTGQGFSDLAVATTTTDVTATFSAPPNSVAIFKNDGTGRFTQVGTFATGTTPTGIVAGDFHGNYVLHLATANRDDNTVSVLRGHGDGTFDPPQAVLVGNTPTALATGDFNGDGHLDLVVADGNLDLATANPTFKGDVSILLGKGDGLFQTAVSYVTGFAPRALVVGDLNGDGISDLATANHDSLDVSVLLGNRDGTFQGARAFSVDGGPFCIATGDFNADGRADLMTANNGAGGNVTVLLGRGDATFQDQVANPVGPTPRGIVTGDFNNDGLLDAATFSAGGDVSVLLGQGDGTFQQEHRFAAGNTPTALVAADFNQDGRLDLAVTAAGTNQVQILLGLGDGTFRTAQAFAVGGTNPVALVTGDFNGDGIPDLAIANAGSNSVSILLGRGDGTFVAPEVLPVGGRPAALATSDFNGDGHLDLVTANPGDNTISILLGNGDGTFLAPVSLAIGSQPSVLAVGDFNGDGRQDLAVGNADPGTGAQRCDVAILLAQPGGLFQPATCFDLNDTPTALALGDFNGDGHVDLAASTGSTSNVRVLQGNGDGTFQPQVGFNAPGAAYGLAPGDFNGDGLTDLVAADQFPNDASVLLSTRNGTTLDLATPATVTSVLSTPLLADLNGDGIPDSVVLSQSGRILLRLGEDNRPGAFAPPVVVNLGRSARAIAIVHAGSRLLLAASDQALIINKDQVSSAIVLYGFDAASRRLAPQALLPLAGGQLLTRVVAGDLGGQFPGFDDLAVLFVSNAHARVAVFLSDGLGGFATPPTVHDLDGNGPVDMALANVSSHVNGTADLLVTNQLSADVDLLLNNGNGEDFSERRLLRAGTGLYGVVNPAFWLTRSREQTAQLALGDFNNDGIPDVVAADPGANELTYLAGRGPDSFANPVAIPLSFRPAALVAARFRAGDVLDLAVLDATHGLLHILLGDGTGKFTEDPQVDPVTGQLGPLVVGSGVTGLSVADVNGDGIFDLEVGNQFGDVLVLQGNALGQFQPLRTDSRTPFVTAHLNGDVLADVILANKAHDRVVTELRQPGTTTFMESAVKDRRDGLIGPGALALADLNGDGIPDLIVANSDSNNVLVYLGGADGSLGSPRSFFAGTNPWQLTVQDLNGDGIPDLLVANQGSNDVTILFGQGDGTFLPGPRLAAGNGPIATEVRDVTGDGIPDLLVTNGQDGTVTVLPGRGHLVNGQPAASGFFDDAHPITFALRPDHPILVAENRGFFVTNTGDIIGGAVVDANHAAFTTVFTSDPAREVRFVAPFFESGSTIPVLFAARADDSISELISATGDAYVEARALRDPLLTDPSQLDVLAADGRVDLYVSNEGQDVPVVVAFDLRMPVGAPPEFTATFTAVLEPLPSSTVPIIPVIVADNPEEQLLSASANLALVLAGDTSGAVNLLAVIEQAETTTGAEERATGLNASNETGAGGVLLALAGGGDETALDDATDTASDTNGAPILEHLKKHYLHDIAPTPEELLNPDKSSLPGDRKDDPVNLQLPRIDPKPITPPTEPEPSDGSRPPNPPDPGTPDEAGVSDDSWMFAELLPRPRDVAGELGDSLQHWEQRSGTLDDPTSLGTIGYLAAFPERQSITGSVAELLTAALLMAGNQDHLKPTKRKSRPGI